VREGETDRKIHQTQNMSEHCNKHTKKSNTVQINPKIIGNGPN